MIYVSIDIETTGLDENNCQILSFGAIIEDTKKKLPFEEIPKFYAVIPHKNLSGSPTALNMNKNLIEIIHLYNTENEQVINGIEDKLKLKFIENNNISKSFYRFLFDNGLSDYISEIPVAFDNNIKPIKFNVAGKNFGTFDKKFLQLLPWWKKLFVINQRILDPAILFTDWKEDETLPNLTECKKRAGIDGIVTHNALEDAWDVIELLRKKY